MASVFKKMKVLVTQSCPTLCYSMGCSLPGSSAHGILQAKILEWVAIPFSRDLPNPGIEPGSLNMAGSFVTIWATREGQYVQKQFSKSLLLLIVWGHSTLSWKGRLKRLRPLTLASPPTAFPFFEYQTQPPCPSSALLFFRALGLDQYFIHYE